jgi:hypothetical protein
MLSEGLETGEMYTCESVAWNGACSSSSGVSHSLPRDECHLPAADAERQRHTRAVSPDKGGRGGV